MVELLVFAAGLTGLVAGVVLDEFSLLVCSFGMKHLESCVGGVVFLQVGAGVTGFGFGFGAGTGVGFGRTVGFVLMS